MKKVGTVKEKRRTVAELFNGKTIEKIDTGKVDGWIFHFVDGTQAEVRIGKVNDYYGLFAR